MPNFEKMATCCVPQVSVATTRRVPPLINLLTIRPPSLSLIGVFLCLLHGTRMMAELVALTIQYEGCRS